MTALGVLLTAVLVAAFGIGAWYIVRRIRAK